MKEHIKFTFSPTVAMDEVLATLHLSRLATASLHGEDRVRQQAPALVDARRRTVSIDTSRDAGQSLALIFGGFVRMEFGDDAVQSQPATSNAPAAPAEVLT